MRETAVKQISFFLDFLMLYAVYTYRSNNLGQILVRKKTGHLDPFYIKFEFPWNWNFSHFQNKMN